MIEIGFFPGAYIDETNRKVVLQQKGPDERDRKAVHCKNCGVDNRIVVGETGVCEYCGSPLQ